MSEIADIAPVAAPGPLAKGLLGVVLLLAAACLLALWLAGRQSDRQGELLAVFPPGTSPETVLGSTARAEGYLLGATALPWTWHVTGAEPDFAGRLLRSGAVLALPIELTRGLVLAGCVGTTTAR
ncbi:MAG: hypothetical protein U1E45_10975 [Geminicoccaceae bacterium]